MRIFNKTSPMLAAAAVIFVSAMGVQAAGTPAGTVVPGPVTTIAPPAAGRGPRAAAEAPEVATLREAFRLLRESDHDYQGHRVKAMRAIAQACRLRGTEIGPVEEGVPPLAAGTGTKPPAIGTGLKPPTAVVGVKPAGKEPEPQPLSDQHLSEARSIVQQVRAGIPAGKEPRISALLDDAINELGIALTIK